MGWNFRKKITIFPGVALSIGKRGVSYTVGRRGASITTGASGTRTTVGIPGTGISYTARRSAGPAASGARPPGGVGVIGGMARAALAFVGWSMAATVVLALSYGVGGGQSPPPGWLPFIAMACGAYGARRAWRRARPSSIIMVDGEVATPETHVRCPDCRELVWRDARKCRHCGTALIPQ